ncbi:MAG: Hsp20/alpha crystallin family protein, partial [Candidatus Binatia bacterium]
RETAEQGSRNPEEQRAMTRRQDLMPGMMPFTSPVTLMRSFMEDLDRLFEGLVGGGSRTPQARGGGRSERVWMPAVELFERDNQLVVRAELPGVERDQIRVEFDDDRLVISGERREEREDRQQGFTERIYGRFYRMIPLPEGVDPEQARATFNNGVLEVTIPVPQRQSARRIEIQEGAASGEGAQSEGGLGQSGQQGRQGESSQTGADQTATADQSRRPAA